MPRRRPEDSVRREKRVRADVESTVIFHLPLAMMMNAVVTPTAERKVTASGSVKTRKLWNTVRPLRRDEYKLAPWRAKHEYRNA
jgi:hypothetical protein